MKKNIPLIIQFGLLGLSVLLILFIYFTIEKYGAVDYNYYLTLGMYFPILAAIISLICFIIGLWGPIGKIKFGMFGLFMLQSTISFATFALVVLYYAARS